jgi:hypothetical protein
MAYQDTTTSTLLGNGLTTEYGSFLPPGGRAVYVHNSGGRTTDPAGVQQHTYTNLNDALNETTGGNGDTVFVLPGHAENISRPSQLSNLKPGTRIRGLGWGNLRPTFTFSVATATFNIDVNNIDISNCIFNCAGDPTSVTALTVAVAFPITGAGVSFTNCDMMCAVDTDQLCTNMITLSAAADDFTLRECNIHGGTTGTVTSVLVTTGAVDRLKILRCSVRACATAQLFDLSNAAITDNEIIGNIMQNKLNTTTAVIKPHATATGIVHDNIWMTAAGATAPASSGFTTYTTTYWFGLNYCSTVAAATAIVSPGVDS